MLRAGPPMLVRTKLAPLSLMSILNLGGMGGLGVAGVVVGNMASICSFAIGSVSSSSVWRTLRTTYRMPANRLGTPTIARITPRPFHQSADSHSRISFMPINLTVPLEVSHAVSEA